MANIFASKPPTEWFAYHPIFADGQLTYPFATNLISGLLMRAGVPLEPAFVVPSILYALLFLLGGYTFLYLLLKSRKQAVLGLSFFLLSAGWGVFKYLEQLKTDGFVLPQGWDAYTALTQYEWYTGNFIDGMLVPQRALLLGMTIALWVLAGLVWVLRHEHTASRARWILLLAGLGAGVLPITHAHSFIALIFLSGALCLAFWRRWRELAWFVVPAGVIGSILYLQFVAGGIQTEGFTTFQLGWTAKSLTDWLVQWWLQWGFMLPVAVATLLLSWRQLGRLERVLFTVFLGIFVLGNMFVFQPVRWDNTKLFIWSYLGFAALAARSVVALWHHYIEGKVVAVVLCVSLVASGAVELARLFNLATVGHARLSSSEEIRLGEQIRRETDTQARFLTAPQHNHFVMMWGARPILMGYTAWAWNFGFEYKPVEQDIRRMYLGGDEAEALLRKHRVSYVVIGPSERRAFAINEDYFTDRFPLAFAEGAYHVYDVRSR